MEDTTLQQRSQSILFLGYKYHGEYEKAIYHQQEALDLAGQLGDSSSITTEYNRIGIIYNRMGEYSTALKFCNYALQIRLLGKDSISIANLYNNLGNIYRRQGNLDLALEYFFKTINIIQD